MFTAQVILLVLTVWGLFRALHEDFYGRPAKRPGGFSGGVGTAVSLVICFWLYWKAGALSLLLAP